MNRLHIIKYLLYLMPFSQVFFLAIIVFMQGNVYVKCPNIACAVAAVNALHGRWFAGTGIWDLSRIKKIPYINNAAC